MEYSELEIRQANSALGLLLESKKLVEGYAVRSAMGAHGDPYNMVTVLTDDLKLIVRHGDSWALSREGRKAARMGFARYIRYRQLMDALAFWGPVASVVAAVASIIGAVISFIN